MIRKKIYKILNKVYGILMTVSFFAGGLPLIGFIVALIIGGDVGARISTFLYKQYYPWVIVLGSVAIVVGLIAMYIGKLEGLSIKKVSVEEKTENKEVIEEPAENKEVIEEQAENIGTKEENHEDT